MLVKIVNISKGNNLIRSISFLPLRQYCVSKFSGSHNTKILYSQIIEEAINTQILNELRASYNYLSMATYFAKSEIGLHGSARFFQGNAEDELKHAKMFMTYQLMRGGAVHLHDIPKPEKQCWPTLLEAFENSLEVEIENAGNLNRLCGIADEECDYLTQDWISENVLHDQMVEIRTLRSLIARLREMGCQGVGLHLMDEYLLRNFPYKGELPFIEFS